MTDLVKGISNRQLLEDAAEMYYDNFKWFFNNSFECKNHGNENMARTCKNIADDFYAKYDKVKAALYEMKEA